MKTSTSQRSPLSPTRWPPDAFEWRRSLLAVGLWLIVFFIGQLLAGFFALRAGTTRADLLGEKLTWGLVGGQYAGYLPVAVLLIAMLPWLARRSLRDLGIGPIDGRVLRYGVLGALAMYAVTLAVANVQFSFTHAKPQEAAITLFTSAKDPAILFAFGLIAVVAAPMIEELQFRGLIFNVLLKYLPVWAAAVASGIIFGAFHFSASAFLPLAASGIVLAYVYYLSGSLTASMITHGLFNLANVLLISLVKM